jgi:hypothetical protein
MRFHAEVLQQPDPFRGHLLEHLRLHDRGLRAVTRWGQLTDYEQLDGNALKSGQFRSVPGGVPGRLRAVIRQ